MGDLQKFLKSLERPKKGNVAFGSGSPRKTFPEQIFATKISLTYIKPNGRSINGPATRNVDETINMVKESGKRIANVNGYLYRTEPRFKTLHGVPSHEFEYMEKQKRTSPKRNSNPFGSSTPTMKPRIKSITRVPGPGTYSGQILRTEKNRRIASFGGKTITVPPVTIKCVPVYEDRCEQCKKAPVGVYYQNKHEILCRKCFARLLVHCQRKGPMKRNDRCASFKKVRDCSFCHEHQGATAAVWTKPISLLHRQQVLETYFNKYF